jgi:hypothetical protein
MVTVGTDPEFFLSDTRTGGVIPSCGLIGGTKGNPIKIPDLPKGFGLQEDNVMVEVNVPPATSAHQFLDYMESAMFNARGLIETRHPYLSVDEHCTRLFSDHLLTHPQAKQVGCAPDFDSYNDTAYDPIQFPQEVDGEWRFCGGHIHLGYESDVPGFVVARLCDLFIGLPSIGQDKQGMRRDSYGQAGRWRKTPYGIEYRTLSNYWLWSDYYIEAVAENALRVGRLVERADQNVLRRKFAEVPWEAVKRGINTEDAGMCQNLIQYVGELFDGAD